MKPTLLLSAVLLCSAASAVDPDPIMAFSFEKGLTDSQRIGCGGVLLGYNLRDKGFTKDEAAYFLKLTWLQKVPTDKAIDMMMQMAVTNRGVIWPK